MYEEILKCVIVLGFWPYIGVFGDLGGTGTVFRLIGILRSDWADSGFPAG